MLRLEAVKDFLTLLQQREGLEEHEVFRLKQCVFTIESVISAFDDYQIARLEIKNVIRVNNMKCESKDEMCDCWVCIVNRGLNL